MEIAIEVQCNGFEVDASLTGDLKPHALRLHLALSQRLSPLGLIFRFPTPTSDKIILFNFRISLLKYIKLINYYSRHYALSKIALLISFDHKLLEL